MKGDWVFNAICRKSCHQLVIELTKIYLEGINFLLSRNSWILKLWNDVRWILKLEFESIGKLCQLVSWADQALTKFDSFEILSGCKNRDKNSSWHIFSREFWFCLLVQKAQIATYESIFSLMIAFTLEKWQIYYPSVPTTTLIPKTSKTSPVSLASFHFLTFSLVLWLLTSTFTPFPIFPKVLGLFRTYQ